MVYYYHYLRLLKKTIGKCLSLADTKNMTLIRPLLFSGATIHCSRQKAQEQPTSGISAARMCPGSELVIQQGRPEASKTSQDWTESSQDTEKYGCARAGMGWPVLKPEDLLTITWEVTGPSEGGFPKLMYSWGHDCSQRSAGCSDWEGPCHRETRSEPLRPF